jgi:hypothetical protein
MDGNLITFYVTLALIFALIIAIIVYALRNRLTSIDISASAEEGKFKVTADPAAASQGHSDVPPSGVEVDRNLTFGHSDVAIDHNKTTVNDNLTIGKQKVRIGPGATQQTPDDKGKD